MTKDEIALARYGVRYERLSAFGKRDIDRSLEEPSYMATLNVNERSEEITLRQTLAKRDEQLEAALQENEDLWEQLTEARAELEEVRSKFNPPSS